MARQILEIEAVNYVARALRDGLTIITDEMTVGPYPSATGVNKFAVFLDKPRRHGGRTAGRYEFFDPRDAGVIVESYYGRGETRKLVVKAYEKAGLRVPEYEMIRRKKR